MDRRRKLINGREDSTRRLLNAAAQRNGAEVFAKIRIADALDMDRSGLENEFYSYGLKAHFDFVVADADHRALFAVEFDGPHHESDQVAMRNDRMKNAIARRLGLPLARVRDRHIFESARGLDYLTWLVEVFFGYEALVEAQGSGAVPVDEPLDPMMFAAVPHLSGAFPLFVSAQARVQLQRAFNRKVIAAPCPLVLTARCADGTTVCLAIVGLTSGGLLLERSSLYLDGFGVAPSEAAEEIAVVSLERAVANGAAAASSTAVRAAIIDLLARGTCYSTQGMHTDLCFSVTYEQSPMGTRWRIGGVGNENDVVLPVVQHSGDD
jgi:hypothetical protein